MGKYTLYKEKFIDNEIQRQIDLAVSELKVLNPVSIILLGGFGRGEGGVKIVGKNVTPVNDYDMYVVTNNPVKEEILNGIAKKIEKRIGSKGYSLYGSSNKDVYFDLRCITLSEVKKLPCLIKYYEVKHASHIVYGDDVRKLMPDYDKEKLPLEDGIRFLFNRISHITEWYLKNYLSGEKVTEKERETIIDDTSKAYLSMATVLCLLSKTYAPTYLGCMKNLKKVFAKEFPQINKEYPDMMERIEFHTYLKLKPDFTKIKDVNKMWFRAREHVLAVARLLLKEYDNIGKLEDFNKISNKYLAYYTKQKFGIGFPLSFFAQLSLNVIWFSRIFKFRKELYPRLLLNYRDPGIRIFGAVPFVIQSVNPDGSINKKMMKLGIKKLKSVYPVPKLNFTLSDYDILRKTYTDAWALYYFQKLL